MQRIVEKTNVNVNVISQKINKRLNVRNVATNKAQYLVDKFKRNGYSDADGCYFFFVKCFSKLPENTIWSIYEKATTTPGIRSSIKYFIGACRNQMRNLT